MSTTKKAPQTLQDFLIESSSIEGTEVEKSEKTKTDPESTKSEAQKKFDNERKVLKGHFEAIIHALDTIDEEREAVKEILSNLKANHGIEPKIARKVAKILRNAENRKDYEDELQKIIFWHDKIK